MIFIHSIPPANRIEITDKLYFFGACTYKCGGYPALKVNDFQLKERATGELRPQPVKAVTPERIIGAYPFDKAFL